MKIREIKAVLRLRVKAWKTKMPWKPRKPVAAAMALALILTVGAGLNPGYVRKVWAICNPFIFGDWAPTYTVLLTALTENRLVAQAKGLLARKLKLEYNVGSMLSSMVSDITDGAVTTADLSNALDFATTINTQLDAGVTKEKTYIADNIDFTVFKDALNEDLIAYLDDLIKTYLDLEPEPEPADGEEQEIIDAWNERWNAYTDLFSGGSEYLSLLEDSAVTSIYKPWVASLNTGMTAQMDLNAGYCLDMSDLGSSQDINDAVNSITLKDNTSLSINKCDEEATKGIDVVMNSSGAMLKIMMELVKEDETWGFAGKHGENLLDLLETKFGLTRPKNQRYNCTAGADSFSSGTGGAGEKCRNIVTAVNAEAVTFTTDFLTAVQTQLKSLSAETSSNLRTHLETKISETKSTVATVINAEKGLDVKIQSDWKDKLANIEAAIAALDTSGRQSLIQGTVSLNATETVAKLMPGLKPAKKQDKADIRSFIVAKEAMDVAASMKSRIGKINSSPASDDDAWKDYARATYYKLVLDNELLKIKAARVMGAAGKNYSGALE